MHGCVIGSTEACLCLHIHSPFPMSCRDDCAVDPKDCGIVTWMLSSGALYCQMLLSDIVASHCCICVEPFADFSFVLAHSLTSFLWCRQILRHMARYHKQLRKSFCHHMEDVKI